LEVKQVKKTSRRGAVTKKSKPGVKKKTLKGVQRVSDVRKKGQVTKNSTSKNGENRLKNDNLYL